MNVEVVPRQGKPSKGVLTMKVANGMLHKLSSFTTALMHDWKMYGTKKENGNIEIKLGHKHLETIVFDQVLRFDDAILVAAKITTLPDNISKKRPKLQLWKDKFPRKCYTTRPDMLDNN